MTATRATSPWDFVAEQWGPADPYLTDPARWATERLGDELWSMQRTILESVRDHRHTAVHACHDSSKSFTASRVACWWLDTHKPGEAFVVSSAPSAPQVRAILWREINRAHRKGNLPGRVTQTEWWIGEEMVGFGRKPPDVRSGETMTAFQGIHARYVLVLLDEASGIVPALWEAADTLATNEGSRVLAIGNPDDPSSQFAKNCRPGSGWHVIHIDGLLTPNFTGEPVSAALSEVLLSKVWVEERKARWGEESPLYLAKVRGLFPTDDADGVVPYSWIVGRCQGLEPDGDEDPVQLGLDVGGGGDESVIRERRGRRAGRVWRQVDRDPEKVKALALLAIRETGATSIKVDTIGIGWGIAGWIRATCRDEGIACTVVPVNVGAGSTDPKRFPKLRDQIWWEIGRELSESAGWDLSEVDDDTVAQLVAPKYALDASGRVKVEPKEDTKSRLGRSPDDADSLLLAYFAPTGQGDAFVEAWRGLAAAKPESRASGVDGLDRLPKTLS